MASTASRLETLNLSAEDLKREGVLTDPMIIEWLNLLYNFGVLSNEIDLKNNILKNTTVVTFADSPYTPLATDDEIFFDTTDGDIDCSLPPGIDGTNYRMINVGFVDNVVNLIPALTNKLFGLSENEVIYDAETVIITFDEVIESWY